MSISLPFLAFWMGMVQQSMIAPSLRMAIPPDTPLSIPMYVFMVWFG
jgi:hypothetical protein